MQPKIVKDPPKITQKEGKSIFSEDDFRSRFCEELTERTYHFQRPLSQELRSSLEGQRQLGAFFHKAFKSMRDQPFIKGHLQYPWPYSKEYEFLHGLWLHHPCYIEPFITSVNQYFYWPVLETWRKVQGISYFKNTSDYCARSLPGTNKEGKQRAIQAGLELEALASTTVPTPLKPKIMDAYTKFFGKRWEAFGGALLPIGYLPGASGYGRLKSIPPSTICNMNKKVKLCILKAIKAQQNISFFEVDLKSCHAKIFEDLFDWSGYNRNDLPPLDDLWPNMIADFWEKANQVRDFDFVKNQIQAWPDGYLKGLLKNQFYKALNGGMPDYAEDNVERSKTKLKIAEKEQAAFNEYLHMVFSQMKVFVLETAFIEQINKSARLYLPNNAEGFKTDTLSKSQIRKMAKSSNYTPNQQTGNSRLFSNMELCLIMHLYAAIATSGYPWLVVGYEADGILVASLSEQAQAEKELETVQDRFRTSIRGLTTAEHSIDFKNFV